MTFYSWDINYWLVFQRCLRPPLDGHTPHGDLCPCSKTESLSNSGQRPVEERVRGFHGGGELAHGGIYLLKGEERQMLAFALMHNLDFFYNDNKSSHEQRIAVYETIY